MGEKEEVARKDVLRVLDVPNQANLAENTAAKRRAAEDVEEKVAKREAAKRRAAEDVEEEAAKDVLKVLDVPNQEELAEKIAKRRVAEDVEEAAKRRAEEEAEKEAE